MTINSYLPVTSAEDDSTSEVADNNSASRAEKLLQQVQDKRKTDAEIEEEMSPSQEDISPSWEAPNTKVSRSEIIRPANCIRQCHSGILCQSSNFVGTRGWIQDLALVENPQLLTSSTAIWFCDVCRDHKEAKEKALSDGAKRLRIPNKRNKNDD